MAILQLLGEPFGRVQPRAGRVVAAAGPLTGRVGRSRLSVALLCRITRLRHTVERHLQYQTLCLYDVQMNETKYKWQIFIC